MINEHDITDMCNLEHLHEGDKFTIGADNKRHVFKIKNFTGDYVFCYDHDGVVHHFARWIKVYKV